MSSPKGRFANRNQPSKCTVDGIEYDSFYQAGQAHGGLHSQQVKMRCASLLPDWENWTSPGIKKDVLPKRKGGRAKKRPVVVGKVRYPTILAAAQAKDIRPGCVQQRIEAKTKWHDWRYA